MESTYLRYKEQYEEGTPNRKKSIWKVHTWDREKSISTPDGMKAEKYNKKCDKRMEWEAMVKKISISGERCKAEAKGGRGKCQYQPHSDWCNYFSDSKVSIYSI